MDEDFWFQVYKLALHFQLLASSRVIFLTSRKRKKIFFQNPFQYAILKFIPTGNYYIYMCVFDGV